MRFNELIPWGRKEAGLTKQEGGSPVLALQREMNRLFDEFWSRFQLTPFGSGDGMLGWATPRVDVAESDKEVEVAVELPGIDEKDIEVSVTDNLLTIKGEKNAEREEKKRNYYLSERSSGSFYRSIPLPPGVVSENAKAEFKKGVLTVTLPKAPEAQAKVKKIEVKAA